MVVHDSCGRHTVKADLYHRKFLRAICFSPIRAEEEKPLPMSETGSLTGDSEEHVFSGFLFDLDGTIIETTDALTKHWKT